jgi:hypothetical protein
VVDPRGEIIARARRVCSAIDRSQRRIFEAQKYTLVGHQNHDGNLQLVVPGEKTPGRVAQIQRAVHQPLTGAAALISGEDGIGLEKRSFPRYRRS